MKIVIQKAKIEDTKKANEFLTRLIHDEKKYDSNINDKFIVESLYENICLDENICLLVAKNEDEIVGYLFGFVNHKDNTYIDKIAKLEAMFVDENIRGKKIGTLLISEFKKWAKSKDCRFIELSVCNNNSAINLYKKEGFISIKTIMSLDLTD